MHFNSAIIVNLLFAGNNTNSEIENPQILQQNPQRSLEAYLSIHKDVAPATRHEGAKFPRHGLPGRLFRRLQPGQTFDPQRLGCPPLLPARLRSHCS